MNLKKTKSLIQFSLERLQANEIFALNNIKNPAYFVAYKSKIEIRKNLTLENCNRFVFGSA